MPSSRAAERWIIATGNAGKLAELERALAPYGVVTVPQSALQISAAPETAATFVENALLKARHAAAASGLPALADDSGLCVAALEGAPGLRSARFAGPQASPARNTALLLEKLRDVPQAARQAHFVCAIVAMRSAADPDPLIGIARWHGRIAAAPRGGNGFGYDPVFEIPALGATAAELDAATKQSLSHRG
ncbi:MAG TPA: RdgB/HAM1 family non-canonical purine NTP pyrophosphatase, partial [Gammaproteobacteria bacterium]|nr:RdgB/HAM1 family non-canonical purine NTP pyrophosphatase [Gammaproteobacteria bacterium]